VKQRIITALLLAPIAIAAVLWLPTSLFLVLVAAVMLLGLWEWTRLAGVTNVNLRALVLAVHAGLMAWLAWRGWPELFKPVVLLGVLWWALALLWLGRARLGGGPRRRNVLLKLVAGTLMIIPAWAALALLHGSGPLGPRWALFALFVVWAADTFAYFAGSRIGGRKLAPSISPGKTWAGFIGGLVGALVICVPWLPLLGIGWSQLPALLLLAVFTALASVVGDLFESLAKRHSGSKDSGALIPGHGGVMDRLDSIVAALPVFAIGKIWLGL
jgi:phosphatidate cytidylyltransferase